MSGTKSTPGPWEVRVEEQHYVTSADDRIANVLFPRYSADGAEVMANARLIAAAPCMLEALQDALCALECCGKDYPAATKASAAIAKATGGTP